MINPDINFAPIAALVFDWQSCGRYSPQALRRLLSIRLDAARWHALHGVPDYRDVQRVNALYLRLILEEMSEERMVAA